MAIPACKLRNLILVILFTMGIFAPLIVTVLPVNISALDELRTKQSAPGFPRSRRQFKRYPRSFERFYQDNFGLRAPILYTYNILNHWLIHRSNKVIFGRQGWLFFSGDEGLENLNSEIIKDHCGQLRFTHARLEAIKARFITRTNRLRRLGIEYWVVIAPNKHTIYSQFLPAPANCRGNDSLRAQLMTHLSDESDLNVLDLTSALRTEAERQPNNIFRKTDTHWNGRGVWRAYSEIIKMLKPDFPKLREITHRLKGFGETRSGGGDLARLLGLQHDLEDVWMSIQLDKYRATEKTLPPYVDNSDEHRPPALYSQPDIDAPRLLTLHDSFTAIPLKQVMAESFSESLFVWHSVSQYIPWGIVDNFQPDIVIHEFVERTLAQPAFIENLGSD